MFGEFSTGIMKRMVTVQGFGSTWWQKDITVGNTLLKMRP